MCVCVCVWEYVLWLYMCVSIFHQAFLVSPMIPQVCGCVCVCVYVLKGPYVCVCVCVSSWSGSQVCVIITVGDTHTHSLLHTHTHPDVCVDLKTHSRTHRLILLPDVRSLCVDHRTVKCVFWCRSELFYDRETDAGRTQFPSNRFVPVWILLIYLSLAVSFTLSFFHSRFHL